MAVSLGAITSPASTLILFAALSEMVLPVAWRLAVTSWMAAMIVAARVFRPVSCRDAEGSSKSVSNF